MHLYPLIAFLASFAIAAILMRWLLALCHKHNIYYDAPTLGQNHHPVPRIGGAIFFPSIVAGVLTTLLLRAHHGDIADTIHLSTFIIGFGTMAIYIIGILDDILHLSPSLKCTLKLAVCAVFPLCTLTINHLYGFLGITTLSTTASYVITVASTFLIVQSINSADDTDGLAATLTLVFMVIIGQQFYHLGYYTYAYLAFALCGALIVFLYHNLWGDPLIGTKTYMGNCGSLTLGFTTAYLTVKYAMDNKHVMAAHSDALLTTLSLLALPVFDYLFVTAKTLWLGDEAAPRRTLQLQHHLYRCGLSPIAINLIMAATALLYYAVDRWLATLGLGLTTIVAADVALYILVRLLLASGAHEPAARLAPRTLPPASHPSYNGEEGLVSVIMPTWNSSQYVARSIESILAQTYTHLELIITDDASTDDTPHILRQYAARDARVRIILGTTNRGAGHTRNSSILAARGQYIAFCDSDDRWLPHKLERQIHFMRTHHVALCYSPYYTCGPHDEYLGYVSAPARISLFQLMCDNKIGFLTAIYDTRLLGLHLMPPQRKRQDHALLLQLLRRCRHAYRVAEPLAHYRLHPGNMSAGKLGLLRYNAQTYHSVFGWPHPLCWAFLLTIFMPSYLWKRIKNLLINISRTQLG